MKKLLSVLAVAATIATSSFALSVGVGGTAFLGKDIAESTATTEIASEVKSVTLDTNLNYGFGLYGHVDLLGALGVQAEANLTKGTTSISGLQEGTVSDFELWTLDVPLMLWLNFDVGPFSIGGGAGVNFSFTLDSGSVSELYAQTKANYTDNNYRTGLAAGLSAKLFVSDNWGIVAKGLFIAELDPTTIPVNLQDYTSAEELPTVTYTRRSLYGAVGLEYKF